MDVIISQEIPRQQSIESVAASLAGERGVMFLRSQGRVEEGRFSFLAARPFLTLSARGSHCEIKSEGDRAQAHIGNPWSLLDSLLGRYHIPDVPDTPFPLGGCFGFWGYELKNFLEPRLRPRAVPDLPIPDCQLGFYSSLAIFDRLLDKLWVVSTGMSPDGSREGWRARAELEFWKRRFARVDEAALPTKSPSFGAPLQTQSNLTRTEFMGKVAAIQRYIRMGEVYQANLSQRLSAPWTAAPWSLFETLGEVSPAPFSAFLNGGDFQLVSSSPELFLRLNGLRAQTRPIKGTRPRSADPARDEQLRIELQANAKEMAELVMITDLLRNDLGKVCEYGSVRVPELARIEGYPQVWHLVSTVEGVLRGNVSHLGALAACFPGGSITGAPKFRAMEIIDELEPQTRGPYTGAIGYLGFNRASQFSIAIRTALCQGGRAWFHTGAGIVADSSPEAEYEETLAKARGFLQAIQTCPARAEETGSHLSANQLTAGSALR